MTLYARPRVRPVQLDPADIRIASFVLLAGAALAPFVPAGSGFACPLRAATGIPCPLCGMTTSVSEVVRLDLVDAVAANPAGPALVVFALGMLALRPRRVRLPALLPLVALPAMWVFELVRFGLL